MAIHPQFRVAPEFGRPHDVCCVGTALIDHLTEAEEAVLGELGLAKATMTLIDTATARRLRKALGEGRVVSGGTVANTAVGIASLGGSPVYVGAVASDDLGARYRDDLLAAGVHAVLEELPESGDEGTGVCFVLVTPDAERTMATNLGVSGRLHHEVISYELLAECTAAYFDGYLLDFPDAEAITGRLVSAAEESGCIVALGLADVLVVERHRAPLQALVEMVDVIFCNQAEALEMTGRATVEEAVAALGGRALCCVTCGPDGAILAQGGEQVRVAAVAVPEVVDLTGAGDLFAAGVLYGLSHGADLEESGRLGALAAAEVIGHLGARPASGLGGLVGSRP